MCKADKTGACGVWANRASFAGPAGTDPAAAPFSPEIMISQRPAEADDRAVPGHWEGDLILGLRSSAIGTLVERTTRFTMLLHLPPMPGHGKQQRVHNGPPLAGHGAQAVRDAIAASIITLPQQLSLTWDRVLHAPHRGQPRHLLLRPAPWQNQRTPTVCSANTSPKGPPQTLTDLDAVAAALNSRPRKTLGWRTPAEALNEYLHSLKQGSVATTP